MQKKIVVIPCYNEAARLDLAGFRKYLISARDVFLLFVDDGSFDDTAALLQSFKIDYPGQVEILKLHKNQGKAEAIRRGFLRAFQMNPFIVGYLDADLAVSLEEAGRLMSVLCDSSAYACFGSRVAMLGRNIQRKASRHYLGRVFATMASCILHLNIYDTQCGAKFFKNGQDLELAFQQPFISRWAFDVELIKRLMVRCDYNETNIIEEPVMAWVDKAGSKLSVFSSLKMGLDLCRIFLLR
jgi:glycosyltransferase involved in cell wall biosynthesis